VHPATPKLDRPTFYYLHDTQISRHSGASRAVRNAHPDLVMTSIVDGLQRPVSTLSVSLGIISLL